MVFWTYSPKAVFVRDFHVSCMRTRKTSGLRTTGPPWWQRIRNIVCDAKKGLPSRTRRTIVRRSWGSHLSHVSYTQILLARYNMRTRPRKHNITFFPSFFFALAQFLRAIRELFDPWTVRSVMKIFVSFFSRNVFTCVHHLYIRSTCIVFVAQPYVRILIKFDSELILKITGVPERVPYTTFDRIAILFIGKTENAVRAGTSQRRTTSTYRKIRPRLNRRIVRTCLLSCTHAPLICLTTAAKLQRSPETPPILVFLNVLLIHRCWRKRRKWRTRCRTFDGESVLPFVDKPGCDRRWNSGLFFISGLLGGCGLRPFSFQSPPPHRRRSLRLYLLFVAVHIFLVREKLAHELSSFVSSLWDQFSAFGRWKGGRG